MADASNTQETPKSNTVKIVKEKEQFEVDNNESKYVSKVYSIKASSSISDYKVELKNGEGVLPDGIKITDLSNNIKTKFTQNEKFKVLIPIKNLIKEYNFNIMINTKVKSKPVLYGHAPNNTLQDYALTAAIYDDAKGETKETANKNETKVKIIKIDEDTNERLENVEFNILDGEKNIIYANLKTDSNGEIMINNMIPGKYYIQEVCAKDGYMVDNTLKEIDILLNDELMVNISNKFEKDYIVKSEKRIEKIESKKLPVTGM